MIQQKHCKAKGKAKDYQDACGTLTDVKRLKYGLCSFCRYDWMKTTENGKIHYAKVFIPKTKKISERNRKEILKEKKIKILSPDKYRAKYLQPSINLTARLIDKDQPCIATGNIEGKMAGGHYLSVGSNRTTALNLHNIHIQTFHSNGWKGGDDKNYQLGLKRIYGEKYFDFIDSLRQHRLLKLSTEEMIEIRNKVLKINIDLKKEDRIYNPNQRIALRNMVNAELGIYDNEYSRFKIKEL